MSSPAAFLSPAEAARRLGVSAKALRLYEERGLLLPGRTPAGWRAYGPADMDRARHVVALRSLGLSLAQVETALAGGDPDGLAAAVETHQAALEVRLRDLTTTIADLRDLRRRAASGARLSIDELAGLRRTTSEIVATFDLPWPWGGERFELRGGSRITFITGPLFSGKTRLAQLIAGALPGGGFVGLDRATGLRDRLEADPALNQRVERAMAWLIEDGATCTDALLALVAALEADGAGAIVVDMIEQGLDEATQNAVIASLRRPRRNAPALFLMTRSTAILDVAAVAPDEAIIFCPANHAPPVYVSPWPGAEGFEALASCLAPPDVRARSEGVVAIRQPAA